MDAVHPRWSKRAIEAINQARMDMPWCVVDRTTLVPSGTDRTQWWTFAGLTANATFAEAFSRKGIKAVADNLLVVVNADLSTLQSELLDEVRASAPELWPATLGMRAIGELKFSDCLPSGAAEDLIRARLSEESSVSRMAALPVKYAT